MEEIVLFVAFLHCVAGLGTGALKSRNCGSGLEFLGHVAQLVDLYYL
jgi:hypothetical protein